MLSKPKISPPQPIEQSSFGSSASDSSPAASVRHVARGVPVNPLGPLGWSENISHDGSMVLVYMLTLGVY